MALEAEKHIPGNIELVELLNTISTFICFQTYPRGEKHSGTRETPLEEDIQRRISCATQEIRC